MGRKRKKTQAPTTVPKKKPNQKPTEKGKRKAGWRDLISEDDTSADDFVEVPDFTAIRRKNKHASESRPVMRQVRTQRNHWIAMFKTAPTTETWTDANLATFVAARCEKHMNPSQRKTLRLFLKHTAAQVCSFIRLHYSVFLDIFCFADVLLVCCDFLDFS
jgi:hypothetical protein